METDRASARLVGAKRYFTGKPCSSGHVSWRSTSNTSCHDCLVALRPAPSSRVKLEGTYYSRNKDRIKARSKPLTRAQKDAANARNVIRYHADLDASREKNKATYRRNRERFNAVSRAYWQENKDRLKANLRAWLAANPEKQSEYNMRRRFRMESGKNDLTAEQISEVIRLQKGKCANCRQKHKRLAVDHIQPLARGGENTRRNIQMLCKSCNSRKHALDPLEFARRQGNLV